MVVNNFKHRAMKNSMEKHAYKRRMQGRAKVGLHTLTHTKHCLQSPLKLSSLTSCIIRTCLHICLPISLSSLSFPPDIPVFPPRPLGAIYKYGFASAAASRISDQIKQSKSDMFPWPDGWLPKCEVLISVGTSISSLHRCHNPPSGEQLEPEERRTCSVSPVRVPGRVSVELSACDLDVKADALWHEPEGRSHHIAHENQCWRQAGVQLLNMQDSGYDHNC